MENIEDYHFDIVDLGRKKIRHVGCKEINKTIYFMSSQCHLSIELDAIQNLKNNSKSMAATMPPWTCACSPASGLSAHRYLRVMYMHVQLPTIFLRFTLHTTKRK